MTNVIKVENLSKAYQLGEIGMGTLSNDLKRFWAKACGNEDPFMKIGELNDRTTAEGGNVVLSLKDINFEIEQGDAVGLIGRNGAGKSTLLKILSRITSPTAGSVKTKGRIASLLEVGTGFHPELTGRENIFLNGAILGMRKAEISRRFDEIVSFSGVSRYVDTPVKKYSSGMYVRLAFAVAAHLESEILIVDEVLAVGDAEFQKKCLGKMGDISKGEGRTVLFVSHNMGSIQQLCKKCILLQNGELVAMGENGKVIEHYTSQNANARYENADTEREAIIATAYFDNASLLNSEEAVINMEIRSRLSRRLSADVRVSSNLAVPVGFGSVGALSYDQQLTIRPGINKFRLALDVSKLALGNYSLSLDITEPNVKFYDRCENCLGFEIVKLDENDRRLSQYWGYGSVLLPLKLL
ncbi:ABC transporter ATP-binding protein [Mucilaginibacter sp.]|uniref:ABC transporter ATP-binding protein n=1 Tax=Mucilaginibacter sp. TaxID=1882438 RepID=UPI0035BBD221